MNSLPTGTVTFLFTDMEGSTKLAHEYTEAWESARARHHAILHDAIESNHGFVFQIVGDSFSAAFHTAGDALKATIKAQMHLKNEAWIKSPIKARMGIHTGATQVGKIAWWLQTRLEIKLLKRLEHHQDNNHRQHPNFKLMRGFDDLIIQMAFEFRRDLSFLDGIR